MYVKYQLLPPAAVCLCLKSRVQKQKQAKHRDQRGHVDNGVSRLTGPSAAASALKGYNLTAGAATEVPSSKVPTSVAESVLPQSQKAQGPAAAVNRPSRSGRNPSGNANFQKAESQLQQHNQPVSKPSAPSTSNINAKRDSFARRAKRDRAAFEGKLPSRHRALFHMILPG